MENIITLAVAMGVPTAITAFASWAIQRNITKHDKARDEAEAKKEKKLEERDRNRERLNVVLLQSITASMSLSEATARAVQRIPDAHCNGDMHKALDCAESVKHAQKDFLTSIGVHSLYDD